MDFSDEMVDEIFKIFQVESEEIISRLNNNILELEKNPNNKDAILLLFRDAHSLKGASRMIGFNNVQTLAHKMEDVLGLAKENKISLNSKVVDILYKTVDLLSELIQKSIAKGQDVYNEGIAQQISILENVEDYADKAVTEHEQTEDFNFDFFKNSFNNINFLIPECLYILMKIETQNEENLIGTLLAATKDLFEIFVKTGPFDVKKMLEDVSVKLEFTMRGSNSLTTNEVEELHNIFNKIINRVTTLCEIYSLKLIDYYGLAFEKMTNPIEVVNSSIEIVDAETENDFDAEKVVVFEQKEVFDDVVADKEKISEVINEVELAKISTDFVLVKNKLEKVLTGGGSVSEVKDFLVEFEKLCTNDNAKSILHKIIDILGFAVRNEIQLNEDVVSILNQSIDYCDNTINNKSEIADRELISQRLEIVQQILDFNREKSEVEIFINPKEEKNKKLADFSDVFNSGTIKTLRVESLKLDTLINQANELSVAKIKTKKHLHELNEISNELEEWQKTMSQVLNYLKYYDKKYITLGSDDASNHFLAKQLLNLFTDNNKKVQKLSSNVVNLYRTIQEDDAKMHVTIDNLNSMVKNIRVLPLATVFHLFGRMVRDIAKEKNKQIDFEIIGSETSTDKKIIEEIKTPLIHIIRNAIDHGIETPEERTKLGKNPTGKIILAARQENNKVIIEIKDDGRGINIEKLKEKALQKGFLTKEELNSMSEEQITNLIFAPGFSTGDEITNISGRGIGLDVVQSKISQLNGKVSVISEFNIGCCVQIELPATIALVNTFLVEVSGQTFAVPIESINSVLRKKENEIIISNNKRSIVFKNQTISLYDLADVLKLPHVDFNKDKRTILVLENGKNTVAISVDKLLGEQEILQKKLSAPFYKLKNISGITTLISGEVCLILNISDIIKSTHSIKTYSKKVLPTQVSNSIYTILLIDDSVTTRTLEKNILTRLGYNVEIAENPIQAFSKMQEKKFNLIISDVEMPEMNGLEFLEKVKSDEKYKEIPIIILSSLSGIEDKNKAMSLGAFKYITKSEFNQDNLKCIVGEILK